MGNSRVICCKEGICDERAQELIEEEPLLIRVDGNPYSVVMRTPGDEMAHVAGFCLAEGVVDDADDFISIGFCQELDPNVIDVSLTEERRKQARDVLQRKSFVSQTSCGICGKEMVKDLHQALLPIENDIAFGVEDIYGCTEKLLDYQVCYNKTRGSHAAMILDRSLKPVSFAEDVGRHNALDKAIGKLLLKGWLGNAAVVVLSSRISYELVQKAARARLPMIVSKSRPTALAVEVGKALNMTLSCNLRHSELLIYCGEQRIRRNP